MASRKDLLKDEAVRGVGKSLGLAPLVGLAGILFGLSLTTHRMPVIVASAVALVLSLIIALVLGRDPKPAANGKPVQPQAPLKAPEKKPENVPAVAAAAPVKPAEPSKSVAPAKPAEPVKEGKAAVKETTIKPAVNKPKKSKKEKKGKKSKKKK
ncbi:MAG: hypothetical protein ACSLFI_06825 [Solirubrobacterales bacterium]